MRVKLPQVTAPQISRRILPFPAEAPEHLRPDLKYPDGSPPNADLIVRICYNSVRVGM